MSDNDKAIAHALLKLPPAERHAAFLEICDGKFDRAPRDRLAAWYSQEKRSAVLAPSPQAAAHADGRRLAAHLAHERRSGRDPERIITASVGP